MTIAYKESQICVFEIEPVKYYVQLNTIQK